MNQPSIVVTLEQRALASVTDEMDRQKRDFNSESEGYGRIIGLKGGREGYLTETVPRADPSTVQIDPIGV